MGKEVVISTSKLNSYKFRILTEGIDYSQYLRNPVMLYNHSREILPVGRMENLRVDGDKLIGTPVFDEKDEFALKLKNKFDNGFLQMFSPGLDPVSVSSERALLVEGQTRNTVTRSKLIEVSIVDIGSNDDAIKLGNRSEEGEAIKLGNRSEEGEVAIYLLSKAGERYEMADISTFSLLTSNLTGLPVQKNEFKGNLNDNEMKIIALKLGLSETATEAEICEKIGVLQLSAQGAAGLQKQLDEQRESAITAEVDGAVKQKRITADKREHFIALGRSSGVDALRSTLEMISPDVKPTDVISRTDVARNVSTYVKLSEVPDAERIELREKDREQYATLFKNEYGFLPELN